MAQADRRAVYLNPVLHHQVKLAAVEDHRDIQDMVAEACAQYLERRSAARDGQVPAAGQEIRR